MTPQWKDVTSYAQGDRVPTWVQPCSVKERPDSPWQIADQHGVCIMQLGWHRGPVEARRVLLAAHQKGGEA